MNVLLVRPRPDAETIGLQHVMVCEPLELEYLAANVPADLTGRVNVRIIDLILEKRPLEEFLRNQSPDLVVFTGYITHVGTIKTLAALVRRVCPGALTAVGGVHAEVVPEDFEHPALDFVYSRNGIEAFRMTLSAMAEGLDAGSIRQRLQGMGAKQTLFRHNHPDRQATAQYRSRYYYMFHRPCALIKTSYGCPFDCSFCFCKEITDGRYFTRDLKDVVDELVSIAETEIYIVDDDFLFDPGRIRTFLEMLRERGIHKKFLVYGRADFVARNRELLTQFRDQGLQAVIVGLESIRRSDLDAYHKGTDININEAAVKVLQSLDIELYATLILPLDFSRQDFQDLSDWVRELGVRFVNLQPLTPLPGTAIFADYEPQLLYPRERYELWDMAHVILRPSQMSIRAFYWEIVKAYHRIILRPKHVRALIRRYGLWNNLRLLAGSSRVTLQYLRKVVRGR